MSFISELLDDIKRRNNITSDYALAEFTGISRARISNYRTGRDFPCDGSCVKIAEFLDVCPAEILPRVHEEKAEKSGDLKVAETWHEVAEAVTEKPKAPAHNAGAFPKNVYYVKFQNHQPKPHTAPLSGFFYARHIVVAFLVCLFYTYCAAIRNTRLCDACRINFVMQVIRSPLAYMWPFGRVCCYVWGAA